MLITCQGGGRRQKNNSYRKSCPEEASEHYQLLGCFQAERLLVYRPLPGNNGCWNNGLPASLSSPADLRAILTPSCPTSRYPQHPRASMPEHPSPPASDFVQEPLYAGSWILQLIPSQATFPPLATHTRGSVSFALYGKEEKKKIMELIPGRREEKNITEGACAQPKLFPEHISWMAQLMHPESMLPAFPAKLFLPPLDGSTSWWKQHCINPSLSPGDQHDRAIVVTAGLEPFTMQAARVVTNRASIDI